MAYCLAGKVFADQEEGNETFGLCGALVPRPWVRVPGGRLRARTFLQERGMKNLVVARYQDGRVVKGISLDVDPARPTFHVREGTAPAVEVKLSDLKALFFVRSLVGNPGRYDRRIPDQKDPRTRGMALVSLGFADGETIVGMTIRYPPNRPFFFVVPVDPESNNIRILVNRDAVVDMKEGSPGA
jgi:hypothetical protein